LAIEAIVLFWCFYMSLTDVSTYFYNQSAPDVSGFNNSVSGINSNADLMAWGDQNAATYGNLDLRKMKQVNFARQQGLSDATIAKLQEYQKLKANPYSAQILNADAQKATAQGLYNPYIQAGQDALGKYQALYQQPLNYQYAPNQGQQNQLNQVGLDINNQTMLGNQQIDANAAMTGGLFGGNRIRQQGQMASDLMARGNAMQQGLNNQFEQQGYQAAYGDRQAELGLLGQTINQGQMASQGLGESIANMNNLQGQLYQGYGNQTAQAILAEQQRRDQEAAGKAGLLTTGLGAAGTIAGAYFGPAGAAIGGAAGTTLGVGLSS